MEWFQQQKIKQQKFYFKIEQDQLFFFSLHRQSLSNENVTKRPVQLNCSEQSILIFDKQYFFLSNVYSVAPLRRSYLILIKHHTYEPICHHSFIYFCM